MAKRGPNPEPLRILLRRRAIERRISQMGRQIGRDFKGQRVHLVGVLKGAAIFLSDLVRRIPLEVSVDFMAVSSYGCGTRTPGQVRVTKDMDSSIEGQNVILVEDILDTGMTIRYLRRILRQRKPRVLRVAVLLAKPAGRLAGAGRRRRVKADYVGFQIPAKFVVGYGLDHAERYRNLPDVYELPEP
jgi:hypoxanthine phosphoribosyltransferase